MDFKLVSKQDGTIKRLALLTSSFDFHDVSVTVSTG